jgi:hypothetical protein
MISQLTRRFLRLAASLAIAATVLGAQSKPNPREHWLEMFARAYFPGRSGQIMLVPKETHFPLHFEPIYMFMHGAPWEYDTHIPLFFHGAPFIATGTFSEPARQQDVAPTLATLLGTTMPATAGGRMLSRALTGTNERPRVLALVVLDAMRADYFTKYASLMPTLMRLQNAGAVFTQTRVDYLPPATSVGHATIGTGADPSVHGQVVNNVYNFVTGKPQPAYPGLDPAELMALTIADVWTAHTDGRAIIVGQGGAIRATAGLVGHGGCTVNGRKPIAASYNSTDATWETNPQCYTMSAALKPFNGKAVWEAAGGQWMGHNITTPTTFRASALFQKFEGDALAAVLEHEAIGADEITDLVLVNIKATDWVSHQHGPDSDEMKAELVELDAQMARLLALLERKAGPGRFVLAVTADHGMPSLVPGGARHEVDDLVAAIHQRFDPDRRTLVPYYTDPANAQFYVDRIRMAELKLSLTDLANFVAARDWVAAAFTEDEVRQAAQRLRR